MGRAVRGAPRRRTVEEAGIEEVILYLTWGSIPIAQPWA
jgi:hypothetical protein